MGQRAAVGGVALCLWGLLCHAFSLDNDKSRLINEILTRNVPRLSKDGGSLSYSIFRGASALRELPLEQQRWIESYDKSAAALLLFLVEDTKYADAAHEVVLGVTPSNLHDAEYAATHPGSGWTERHPLSTLDDWIHSIIHRDGEGEYRGEGNHTGFENALYWAAGGPKSVPSRGTPAICTHVVAQRLAAQALKLFPQCCRRGLVVPRSSTATHSVLADGGVRRTVCIPPGHFDPFCFTRLLQDPPLDLKEELDEFRHLEYRLLLEHCLGLEKA